MRRKLGSRRVHVAALVIAGFVITALTRVGTAARQTPSADETGLANASNIDGNTALHTLAGKGYNSALRWLVERGARVDVANKRGQTPLAMAARHASTSELLRQLGARK